jgi:hypothetical protein
MPNRNAPNTAALRPAPVDLKIPDCGSENSVGGW